VDSGKVRVERREGRRGEVGNVIDFCVGGGLA